MISIILVILAFCIGVLLLWKGSDALVEGTSKTAAQLGVSSLIISVVIIGFGTSAPEFAVSIGAAINNNSDISMGNIIGSCVANLLLVLGISAFVRPIKIKPSIVRRDYLLVFGATIILLISSYLGLLDEYRLLGGVILLILFAAFVIYFIICAKN